MKKLFIAILSLVLLSACGSSSPSGPVMLPTTVEYMGETIGGDVAVQTGKTVAFAVYDADGNPADASLVTTEIVDNSGATIAYGTVSTSNNLLDILNDTHFPNTESQYVAKFYAADAQLSTASKDAASTPIATFPIKVSVSEEDQQSTGYSFTDPMTVYEGTHPNGISTTTTEDNLLYTCYGDDNLLTGESSIYVSRKLDAYSSAFEEPFTAIRYSEPNSTLNINICGITALDSAVRGNETVAVAWLVNDDTLNYVDCGDPAGCYNYYHYAQFSSDGGRTFGTPLLIHHVNIFKSTFRRPSAISIKLDESGLLHTAYISSVDGSAMNIYYNTCTSATCSSAVQVNTVSGSLNNCWGKPPIDTYLNSDGSTTIYIAWMDSRNTHLIPLTPVPYMDSKDIYAARIVRTGDTISVAEEARVNSNPNVGTYQESLVIDREGNPVITWWQTPYSADVPTLDEKAYLAKSFDGLATIRNNIPIMDEDYAVTHYAFLPKVAVDASNYYHITFVSGDYAPGPTGMADTFDVKYVMGSYQYSDSGTDTFDALPARNIISNLSIDGMSVVDTINDSAGRAYLIYVAWPDGSTLMGVEGNINTH